MVFIPWLSGLRYDLSLGSLFGCLRIKRTEQKLVLFPYSKSVQICTMGVAKVVPCGWFGVQCFSWLVCWGSWSEIQLGQALSDWNCRTTLTSRLVNAPDGWSLWRWGSQRDNRRFTFERVQASLLSGENNSAPWFVHKDLIMNIHSMFHVRYHPFVTSYALVFRDDSSCSCQSIQHTDHLASTLLIGRIFHSRWHIPWPAG